MATNFPTSLDALTNPLSTDALTSPSHADQHADANDAIEALQAKVGVNSSSVATSLDYKVGLKADLASPTFTGTPAAPTASALTNTTQLATTAFVYSMEQIMVIALSDEVTSITTGTSKVVFRAPFAMTLTKIPRASLTTASSSGIPTVDINEAGSTILSTKLTIDANEKTSTTAATAAVLSDSSIADDAEITFDIDVAGTGAKGLKVVLYYKRS